MDKKKKHMFIANYICNMIRIKYPEISILRYDSGISVYLKLDNGLAGSIRISDHDNCKLSYLKYRYNVRTDYEDEVIDYEDDNNVFRYYYTGTEKSLINLCNNIICKRIELIKKYNISNYLKYSKERELENKEKRGFHANCYEVKDLYDIQMSDIELYL